MNWRNVLGVGALMLLSCAYGILIWRNDFFPRELIRSVGRASGLSQESGPKKSDAVFNEIAPQFLETDVEALLSIHTTEDARERRRRLVSFLWGDEGLPVAKLPESR